MQTQPRQLSLIELQGEFFHFSSTADLVRQLAYGLPASPAGSVFEPAQLSLFASLVEAKPTTKPSGGLVTPPLSLMGETFTTFAGV